MKKIMIIGFALLFVWQVRAQLTLIVQVPTNTPANDTVFVAGAFNNWSARSLGHAMQKQADGTHRFTLPATGGRIEFKFTRGSWPKGESTANGGFVPNRSYTFGAKPDTLRLSVAGWEDLNKTGGGATSTAAANVKVIETSFAIPQLNGRTRRIWLYLPPDYAQSSKRYPVLYVHDGQNVFDQATSFSGEWQIDESLNRLFTEKTDTAGCIVVAIDNGGSSRLNEYAPWVNPSYGGGEGDAYARFLVETLKPYIDANYRTRTGREHTAIAGSSMGGLISYYAALKYQHVFSKVGIFSPAFWFNSQQINSFTDTLTHRGDFKLYFVAGQGEGSNMVGNMQTLYNKLRTRGFAESELRLLTHTDGQHAEWYWRREFPAAYRWMFGITDVPVETGFGADVLKEQVSLYPNPAQNRFELFYTNAQEPLNWQLVNLQGQIVGNGTAHQGQTAVDIQQIPPGLYFFNAVSGQHIVCLNKLVIY